MKQSLARRSFIKSAALTGIASALAPAMLFGQELVPDLKEDLQVENTALEDKNLVFLFQGDSITDGNRGRTDDPNHIMGHGYVYGVSSRIGADFPEAGFKFYNRGISGNTVSDLEKRWQTDALNLRPDVLSVLIGINDVAAVVEQKSGKIDADQFETILRKLLMQVKMANPQILIVMGIPFVYPVGRRKDNWLLWESGTAERAARVQKISAEFNAVIIDYPTVFAKAMKKRSMDYWIWDGIHPTIFAHELMSREWIKQVSTRLRFLEKYNY